MSNKINIFLLAIFLLSISLKHKSDNEEIIYRNQCNCLKGQGSMLLDSLVKDFVVKKHGLEHYNSLSINVNLLFLFSDSTYTNYSTGIENLCELDSVLLINVTNEIYKSSVFQQEFFKSKQLMIRRFESGYGAPGFSIKLCSIK